LGRLAALLLVVAVPLFLIASNVRWAVNEPRLYDYGFTSLDIPRATGLPLEELRRVAARIRQYFNDDRDLLDLRVRQGDQEVELFSRREVLHMRDVKGLVRGVYRVQEVAGLYLLLAILGTLLLGRRRGLAPLLRLLRWGALLTLVLVAVVGIASAVAWQQVFLLFHLLSFRNLLWVLNPQRDYLIRMFPPGFFLRATLLIALATVVEALLLGLLATLGLRRLRGP